MATDNKYDRQLRLWGSNGQKNLCESNICVLGSSALACQFLKNLVLPGIGKFTLVDSSIVSQQDFGKNFFLTRQDQDQNRAQATLKHLLELNPDVQGQAVVRSPKSVIQETGFFQGYNLIVSTQLSLQENSKLTQICKQQNTHLIIARNLGLFSYLRLYTPEHCIIEGKIADKQVFDLRIHKPFPQLIQYCNEFDLSSLDDKIHGHFPFVVILVKVLDQWKKTRPPPCNFQEKQEFKNNIKQLSRNFFDEENFQEAVNRSYLAYPEDDLPFEIMDILNDQKSLQADSTSSLFWMCCKAVKQFINTQGVPPLTGLFPDMTSDSVSYIRLQSLYYQKSQNDLNKVSGIVSRIAERELNTEQESFVGLFCKNLYWIQVIRYKTLQEEFEEPDIDQLGSALFDDNCLLDWYVGFLAYEQYKQNEGIYPVSLEPYKALGQKVVEKLQLEELEVNQAVFKEFLRYENSEIHCSAAFLGGVCAQEAVKLITTQYYPINNTFLHTFTSASGQLIKP